MRGIERKLAASEPHSGSRLAALDSPHPAFAHAKPTFSRKGRRKMRPSGVARVDLPNALGVAIA